MTDQTTGQPPAPKRLLRLPDIPRNTGAYLLLLLALAAALALRDHDMVERIIRDFLDIGLLVWGAQARAKGADQ